MGKADILCSVQGTTLTVSIPVIHFFLFVNIDFQQTIFKLIAFSGSADVDECQTGVHRCGEGQICHNLPGAYRCDCKMGYQYDAFSRSCIGM